MRKISVDIESFSDVDLIKCGVYRYADSPNFEILLFAYSIDDGEVQIIDLARGEKLPPDIKAALTSPDVIKTAYNAQFERVCLSKYLGISLDAAQWYCTAVQAAELSLPSSLADVGTVLGLERQKMTEGKDLIKYFCVPCAPTKANGGRTRNLPCHAPDKWELFKKYCMRDVDVERQISDRLRNYPILESEHDLYVLDQRINDRGVLVDTQLARQAIVLNKTQTAIATDEAYKLTGLENPNSVSQLKDWLASKGIYTDELSKKTVQTLSKETDGDIQKVLQLRLLMAKTSVKKYEAVTRSVCSDGRVHGMMRFYGANRSGRWAGQILQPQNLPQNHLPDLTLARDIVKAGDFEMLDMLYGNVPNVLSELIRTVLVPKDGCRFIVADFSAIEARVLAWLAGEEWRLDTFRAGGDIYCASASKMFSVPVVKHGENGHLRQKGKVAELACIAEGQLVLTNHGLIPIEKVTMNDKVWDGEDWVLHDGVVYRGEREVITYDGLTATPDHLVWVEGQSQPVQFGIAASCGAHLVQAGDGGNPIRMGENNKCGKKMEQKLESLLCINRVRRLWLNTMAKLIQSQKREIKGLSTLFTAKTHPDVVRQTSHSSQAKMRKSQRQRLPQLWRKRDTFRVPKCNRGRIIFNSKFRTTGEANGNRSYRQQWKLYKRKYSFCYTLNEQSKQKKHRLEYFCAKILALFQKCRNKKIVTRSDTQRNYIGRGNCGIRKTEKLAINKRTARLYDIRNAGRHHRFTVSGKLVHNCGYGGSIGALKAMNAVDMGIPETELQGIIDDWRNANPNIVKFWYEVGNAAMKVIKEKSYAKIGNLSFKYKSGIMFIKLPSGRSLSYVKPRIGTNRFGGESITYMGISQTKKWDRLETFGGKLVENITQAIARDLLASAMLNVTATGYDIVFHVHDEIIAEVPEGKGSVEEMCDLMARNPSWALGLPLNADGYECEYYRKD